MNCRAPNGRKKTVLVPPSAGARVVLARPRREVRCGGPESACQVGPLPPFGKVLV